MKKMHTIARLLSILFYGFIYFQLRFDLLSCLLGLVIVFAITTTPKQKKPEADTSSF